MTSSVAASSAASLFAPNATITTAPDTPGTNNKENKTSAATIGTLTDLLASHTSSNHEAVLHTHPSSSPVTVKRNSSSKIPHPHPLAVLLASKTNQFRRSASLRLRGSKSNLLFNTFSRGNNNNNNKGRTNPHKSTCHRIEHVDTRAYNALATNSTMDEHQAAVTHELTTTGRISPRRKLTLNSQQNTVGLTRSLSLRRNQNQNQSTNLTNKTNSNKESCMLNATEKDLVTQDNKWEAEKPQQEISSTSETSSTLDIASVSASSTPKRQLEELRILSENVQGTQKQDNSKMSLNLNGPTTIAPTTNVRPTTLATDTTPATGTTSTTTTTPSASSRAVAKTASSPKTPKTPIAKLLQNNHQQHTFSNQQHQQHHHHHNHQHCCRYQQQHQQALPSVPETKLTPRTPPVTPDSPDTYLEDDLDSLYSFATTTSGRSTMSCEHPYVARNGTTFSGRKMKYVVHCSNYAGQVGPDYLTPTQRAQRQIRRLKELLCVARQDLEQKDSEILRLTREVVELRLFKASLSSPEDRSASSDAVTVREAELKTSQDVSPIIDMVDDATKCSPRHIVHGSQHQQNALHSEMQSSFADSGHFEDMTSSSVHSKDSYAGHTHDIACGSDEPGAAGGAEDDEDEEDEARKADSYELQRQELIRMYEQRIEELIRTQDSATSEIKRSHNDKVEALLQKLAECNTRYADIVPDYEHAKERIRELEKQLEDLQRKLTEHEEKQNKMYLHMYQKGQEAERIARADQALELAHRAPSNKVSINELLHQLQSTQDELENIRAAECRKETGGNHALLTAKEAISLWVLGARKTIYRRLLDAQKNRTHVDPEVTLQFLKSAVYYFLTDKENSQGHLQAIESILEFTEAEKQNITKARAPK